MKIDFTQCLQTWTGEPLELTKTQCPMCNRPTTTRPATLRAVCADTLVMERPNDRDYQVDGEEKARRYQLALRIMNEDIVDLTPEDLALIRKLCPKIFGPIVVGQIWTMLDPKED